MELICISLNNRAEKKALYRDIWTPTASPLHVLAEELKSAYGFGGENKKLIFVSYANWIEIIKEANFLIEHGYTVLRPQNTIIKI